MPDHKEDSAGYRFKLQEFTHKGQTLKGLFLTLKEYSLLTSKPYQTIVEECGESNNRKLFRKAIYFKDKKRIFAYGNKALYSAPEARVFRLELKDKNPKQSYEFCNHENSNSRGFWINKKEYAELTRQTLSMVTTQTQNNTLEFGQIYEKAHNEYRFFIPVESEDFNSIDVENFKTKLTLKKIADIFEEIQAKTFKEKATKLGTLITRSPELITFLEELSDLNDEQIKNLKEIAKKIKADELESISKMADGYGRIFT